MNVTNLEGQFVTTQNSNRARRTKNLCQETHATAWFGDGGRGFDFFLF